MITPSGKFAYVANYGSVASYRVDPTTGALSYIDPGVHVYTEGASKSSVIDPSGKFAYVASYDSGSQQGGKVSAFNIDAATGRLSEVTGSPFAAGSTLTSFVVDPSGRFAYAANNGLPLGVPGSVSAFSLDSSTGALSEIAGSPFSDGGNPGFMTIDPSSRVAYAVNCESNQVCDISGYTINTTTGALTSVGRVPAGNYTVAIAIAGTVP
jgi:6-phosphogluconolactonase (cycloisomerase 2 family)